VTATAGHRTAVEAAHERIEAELGGDVPDAPAVGDEPSGGRQIVVISPKGGAGRTTVATNLAVALAADTSRDVGLADLSLTFGDVATAMLLDPHRGLADLANAARPLTSSAVTAALAKHPTGTYVLCAPDDPVLGESISTDDVAAVLRGLRATLSMLVVDTAAGMDGAALTAVEHATDLVLVAALDVPTVLALRQALDYLDLLGMTRSRRHLVLNRAGARTGIQPSEVSATLGLDVVATIPDSPLVAVSTNEGRPFVVTEPGSPPARGMQDLVAALDPTAPRPTSRRTLRRRAR
jgi:pilus assembly protein CpaE